jgi:hypothetical protein
MRTTINLGDRWLSGHARTRCQQRGVTRPALALFLDEADHVVPVGSGCVVLTMSRGKRQFLQQRGVGASELDRAVRRAVVVGADGVVISVLNPDGPSGRRYRHRFYSHVSHQR